MQDLKNKFYHLAAVMILVIVILMSNLGQDFKVDIFSYGSTMNNLNTYTRLWKNSSQYQNYIDLSTAHIIATFRQNGISPLINGSYIQEWTATLPIFSQPSSLEVLTRTGKIYKKYSYGKDFIEDFRGLIKPAAVRSAAISSDTADFNIKPYSNILIFSGYNNKTREEISAIDSELIDKAMAGVISPAGSSYLKYESGLYDSTLQTSGRGLAKLVTTPAAYEEIKRLVNEGYIVRMKSGADTKQAYYKNVYGVLKGKNSAYKPLIIAVFYDGILKTQDASVGDFQGYSISPSVVEECIRTLKMQRIKNPDRTIVFAFLSGYLQNKEGLRVLLSNNLSGEIVVLDGLGTGDKNILSFNSDSRNLNNSIEGFLKRNKLEVISKSTNSDLSPDMVNITTSNFGNKNTLDYQTIYNSGKFLLSFIGDECYNLDFLTGNLRGLRIFKGFIKDNTLILSFITFSLLIFMIFRRDT